ncbi:trypsin-like serine protease [Vibrio sp. H11]|uniref:S1 family peptidase n=1 Tax=Vibrio sp. H11 TaxID=2565928 RepID=UPI001455DF4F|nr:trypsin-like serine protease [Vibrio sp. H11]
MNKWVAGSALFWSLGLASGVQADSEVSTYIVNGENTTISAYASFASLFYNSIGFPRESDNGQYGQRSFCGATMLDSTHVLTAAHCLYDEDGELNYEYMLYTTVGQATNEADYALYGTTVRAEQFFIHPNFQDTASSLWANDIAIIKMESTLNPQGTVARPNDESYRLGSDGSDNDTNDYAFKIVGHGNIETDIDGTSQLQVADMTYVPNDTCDNGLSLLSNKQICFKGASTDPDTNLDSGTCQGDSGGPVYWDSGNGLIQVGITSFGPARCGVGFSGSDVTAVFTEIYDYRNWIDRVLAGSETATFVGTDEKRQAFANGTFDPEMPSGIAVPSSGGGGGSLGPWLLAMLAGVALWRRRQTVEL